MNQDARILTHEWIYKDSVSLKMCLNFDIIFADVGGGEEGRRWGQRLRHSWFNWCSDSEFSQVYFTAVCHIWNMTAFLLYSEEKENFFLLNCHPSCHQNRLIIYSSWPFSLYSYDSQCIHHWILDARWRLKIGSAIFEIDIFTCLSCFWPELFFLTLSSQPEQQSINNCK